MPVLVQGIRIESLTVTRNEDVVGFTASYSLLTPDGTVLAKQSVNEYNSPVKLEMTGKLGKAIREMSNVLKSEIEDLIGLKDNETAGEAK